LQTSPSRSDSPLDQYLSVVLVLLATALVGMLFGWWAGDRLFNPVVSEAAITLLIASGILASIAIQRSAAAEPPETGESVSLAPALDAESEPVAAPSPEAQSTPPAPLPPPAPRPHLLSPLAWPDLVGGFRASLANPKSSEHVRAATVILAALGIVLIQALNVVVWRLHRADRLRPRAGQIARPGSRHGAFICRIGRADVSQHRIQARRTEGSQRSCSVLSRRPGRARRRSNRAGRKQASTPSKEPWPPTAWPNVPTRYLLCRNDRLFPCEWVRRIVRDRLSITADEIDSGHCPALSRPQGIGGPS
jgi:hypothetical protein